MSCNPGQSDKLNVHLVPHTHDDVGWLKTVDQYFYGARNNIQHAGVQYILDSVIQSLVQNPERRFIYVEMAFFWRWWNQQASEMQETVKELVNNGRLEFISGGWCMNDEAATHYNSIIDQHSLGFAFLKNTFGDCARPKIGWQIDPFGHSRELASLFAQMGFDGLFFGRADYEDYKQRNKTKTMEMVWKASANLDRQSWLFTGVLPNGYNPPDGFCFDLFCDEQPIMDDPRLHDYNVPNKAVGFATNHIIMTMGSDFQYENSNEWFKNLDKLIHYVNEQQVNGSDVNVFYSTPSCYLYALNKAGHKWTSKIDDFFPYAHHPHGFWTGYFTSRAALKRFERHSNNILQAARQLNAYAAINNQANLFFLNEALGIAQHHDAVSGTEKQHVADDYAMRLAYGIDKAFEVINASLTKLMTKPEKSTPTAPQFLCQYLNISECLPIENQERFTLTLYNPTVHPRIHFARVPVTRDYTIRDPDGQVIMTNLLKIPKATYSIPGRKSFAEFELVFKTVLPALGFNTYYFEVNAEKESLLYKLVENNEISKNNACTLQNQRVRVDFDESGNLKQITNLDKSITVPMKQDFFYYEGLYLYYLAFIIFVNNRLFLAFPGNNTKSEFQASGAYIFRPQSEESYSVSDTRTITCVKTENVQTAQIIHNSWVSQQITIHDGQPFVEVEWTIGPINIKDSVGKEIIVRYDTDIKSNKKYYTDANGREILERVRDYRPTWNYTVAEPVSGNYYPINSRIYIKEPNRQLTILTDRSEGGGSIEDGSIEILIHRRTLYDDALGVGEPLNETAYGTGLVVRGRHWLIVENPDSSALFHRIGAQQIYMAPIATFSLVKSTFKDYSENYYTTWSALNEVLPLNVHLLTFDLQEITADNVAKYLIRVEHYFENNEDPDYSQPVIIDLQALFTQGQIVDMVELTLGANLELKDLSRLEWVTVDGETSKRSPFKKCKFHLKTETNDFEF
ncbi:unnamed protein product [Didymodactylos carnosus]|uniref:Alpha-mannosidase n=1 Tax=Didymodactylos carnosus TaxID=1234261 RepID=A0A814HU12_9BILA|nr:unnamed protein product [Didymodactylos carnosus]CAF1129377.1 unnamed protein product [Didymodactylos carnosus]CAF3785272.1 unnamed protein product [Didymodactylos carnosus]CAF3910620.1 unnamed protein product [Didymodactylos carnosus]